VDSDTSDDDAHEALDAPNDDAIHLLRINQNIPRPRTSQCVFGPNGMHLHMHLPSHRLSLTIIMFRRTRLLLPDINEEVVPDE
jgi:hypothetical protein